MKRVWCELALIDGTPRAGVSIDIVDGRFAAIDVDTEPGEAIRLPGFSIPGLANAHSHAFQRALRSRTQTDRGSFWTWRDLMYRTAQRLEPDSYHRLARAVFGEMVLAGVTCVGEFHYLHHQTDGTTYVDPNEMGRALLAAADDAGLRITLLDTLYLHGGLDADGDSSLNDAQRRFSDGTIEAWANRVDAIEVGETHRVGAAIHSVRAVDPASMAAVAEWASKSRAVVHAHVSEQVAENDACRSRHGVSPTQLLEHAGVLSGGSSVVHATHLDAADVALLAEAATTVVMCPTTERDLGDGIGPTREFAEAGIDIALGSDSHAVIDVFEEARAIELDERLRSHHRGVHAAGDLLGAATVAGHHSLGWIDAGTIAVGQRADLVTVGLGSVRTAGVDVASVIEATMFAATAGDVTDVHVDGRHVVAAGGHATLDVPAELDAAIKDVMGDRG